MQPGQIADRGWPKDLTWWGKPSKFAQSAAR